MHTGYYFGFFLAGIFNHFIGEKYGWRAMFAVGGSPAILVGFILAGVREPEKWKAHVAEVRKWSILQPLEAIFAPEFRRRTIMNSIFVLVSIIGLWAGSVYIPTGVTEIAGRGGFSSAMAARYASYATMLLGIGPIIGCVLLPPLAEKIGRLKCMAVFFFIMMVGIAVGFGPAFYLKQNALPWFFVTVFVLGVGGANFAMYTLWVPEQYPTEIRGSAFAFNTSAGRFIGAGFTFLVGAGVAHFHTIGIPVSLTSIAFLIGLLLLPLGMETKGKPLPN
jgi:MFS family permease